ncbi:uncharacterized protein LOC111005185 [Momordica charantia]|uniref:Uncharacterized protein LOC111005185 n=1 Tax=Momordica charantia TaxID=3673 RepID=A0A6J1BS32_MOMCH|nr:uncharacterized protein LOC111005185 [Momordica charantia]
MSPRSSPYAACFRRSPSPIPPPPPAMSSGGAHSNLTTSIYETPVASFSLTWFRSLWSRSVQLDSDHRNSFSGALLRLNPVAFWKKSGSKILSPSFRLFWDFTGARFGSSPEPIAGFYLALLHHGQIILLVGDLVKEAYARTKAPNPQNPQSLVLKREQVIAHKIYSTKATIAGKSRDIQIDCGYNDDSRLCFAVDGVEVLEVKHLKWKFRGNEKIEVEGVPVQISWDVYNWVFADNDDGHAIFMFRFDQHQHGYDTSFHNAGIETGRMRMSSSLSSVSMSSVGSSAASSSVLDWASVEESELGGGPSAFSLLVYAWKR